MTIAESKVIEVASALHEVLPAGRPCQRCGYLQEPGRARNAAAPYPAVFALDDLNGKPVELELLAAADRNQLRVVDSGTAGDVCRRSRPDHSRVKLLRNERNIGGMIR